MVQDAEESGDSSESTSPTTMSVDAAVALAVASHRDGRIAEAAHIYRQVLAAIPDHVDALHFLGVAEHQVGRSDAALELMNRAIALAPEHADALGNRGNVLRCLRRLGEAEADYRRALALRPGDPDVLSNLGTVLRARGDAEGAIALFRQVIDRAPNHAPAWQNLGSALEECDRNQEALEAFRQAARLAPASAEMFLDLGRALYADGRIREATEMYRRCLALRPDEPRALHLLAACTGDVVPSRASDDYVRREFDQYAATFDASLTRLEYRGPALIAEAVEKIASQLPAEPCVLDAGCGTGLCGPLLRGRAGRLAGVDLSPAMVERARDRAVYDDLVIGELCAHLQQNEQTFDLIVSADTLVYFGDLAQVLASAARALRPGGFFVFTLERAEPDGTEAGYRLSPHGRYSHTHDYVVASLASAGFLRPVPEPTSSRKEARAWVPGWLVTARRATA